MKAKGYLLALLLTLTAVPAYADVRASFPVNAGGDLQRALDLTQPGDEIVIEAAAKFTGEFQLPVKPFGLPITLRSSAVLPDRRIGPADAALFPVLGSGVGSATLICNACANWRIDGIAFERNAGGFGAIIELQDAVNVTFDRIYIDVLNELEQKRAILGNGKNITLTRSYIAGIWRDGQDSQAFAAWDGAGPYTITNNFLEAASENVLFGGSDSLSADRIPADITVEDNLFFKRPSWRLFGHNVKNLFELKAAKRVTVRRNIFDGNWADGQSGWSIVITPRNQEGRAPWTCIEDVLIEANILRNVPLGFNLIGYDNEQFSGRATRIVIRGNTNENPTNYALQASGEIGALEYSANTGGAMVNLDYGGIRPYPETAWRTAKFAVEQFAFFGNNDLFVRSDTANADLALKNYTVQYSLSGPIDGSVPVPPPPVPAPDPVPTPDPCVVTPLRFLKAVQWPSSATGVQLRWSLNRAAKVTFDPTGTRWTVTAIDKGGCSVTVTR